MISLGPIFGIGVLAAVALAVTGCAAESNVDADGQTSRYPQDASPPDKAAPFAPGLVSTEDLEGLPAFSPDMSELYFIRQGDEGPASYVVLRKGESGWTTKSVETTDKGGEVFISPDGNTMFLGNELRDRAGDSWADLQSLGAPFDAFDVMRLTISNGNMAVFDERDEFGKLRFARLVEGDVEVPVEFGPQVNKGTYVAHPYIAPDESYLIFDAKRDGGLGGSDLYISFQTAQDEWSEAINMGPQVNSPVDDIFGSLTPDEKAIIFQRINLDEPTSDVYWVSAKVIDELRAISRQP